MDKRIVAITASAVMVLGVSTTSFAQSARMQDQQMAQGCPGMGPGMMRGGMMDGGMMGGGMMGPHAMGAPFMRIIFALMDSDGNGTVSLQEFQAAHERIFKSMNVKKDGALTLEEMQSFMTGHGRPGAQQ